MADLGGKQVPASYFWGVIRSAVFQTATTGQLWTAIRASAAKEGLRLAPGAFGAVNSLRAMAARQRRSAAAFAGAAREAGIDASMISGDIDSGSAEAQAALPVFRVTFQHLINTPEGPGAEWRTSWYYGALPTTRGELLDDLESQGGTLVDEYHRGQGVSHAGIGQVIITRV